MDNERILYAINAEDVQRVATEEFAAKLTKKDLKIVEEKLGDYIDWYDAVALALHDLFPSRR